MKNYPKLPKPPVEPKKSFQENIFISNVVIGNVADTIYSLKEIKKQFRQEADNEKLEKISDEELDDIGIHFCLFEKRDYNGDIDFIEVSLKMSFDSIKYVLNPNYEKELEQYKEDMKVYVNELQNYTDAMKDLIK